MKYYGTIGPACADPNILLEMLQEGMTGLRLNLSHGNLKDNMKYVELIKENLLGREPFEDFLIDLQGPELRIGNLKTPLYLETGKDCIIDMVPKILADHITEGQELLLDDGKLLVSYICTEESCDNQEKNNAGEYISLLCKVIRGGILQSRKSIAAPGIHIDMPTLTADDLENLSIAKECGVTAVMLPFVRGAEDIVNLRKALKANGAENIEVYAKIESLEGFRALESFIDAADHIVIARGDLGNAVPLWELPGLQRRIEVLCKAHNKPYMVVTQMLNSMIENKVPTRAEVNDVYLAVLHGASSIMLTGETASGKYPACAMRYLIKTGEEGLKDRMNEIGSEE